MVHVMHATALWKPGVLDRTQDLTPSIDSAKDFLNLPYLSLVL